MRKFAKISLIISLAASLAACATTQRPHNYIDAAARPMIQEMDSVLITHQDKLKADIKISKISSFAQGYFAPILFDAGVNIYRSVEASKIIKPINETASAYDYKTGLKDALNEALRDSDLGGASDLEIIQDEPLGFRTEYIENSKADAVMFIDVKYSFTSNFDALKLLSSVVIFPVNSDLSPHKEKPDDDDRIEYEDNIYRNGFGVGIPVTLEKDKSRKKSENGALWAQMSEEELAHLFKLAAQKLAFMIADDLRIDDLPDATVDNGDLPAVQEVIPEIDLPDWATGAEDGQEAEGGQEKAPAPVTDEVPDPASELALTLAPGP